MQAQSSSTRSRNKCNEFIIMHLIRLKATALRCRNDRMITTYNSAINSVQKYPLPLICESQLKTLAGIGDYLGEEITKLIKKHYKMYLKCDQQKRSIQNIPGQISQIQQTQLSQNQLQTNTCKSITSQGTTKNYRPRPNTIGAHILMSMSKLSQFNVFINKKQIIQHIKTTTNEKVKGWSSIQQTLITHNYIKLSENSQHQISLTQKGRQYSIGLHEKVQQAQSKSKAISEVQSFKQFYLDNIQEENQQVIPKLQPQKAIYNSEAFQLTLVIDSRQIKDQLQRSFFQDKLKDKYSINCTVAPLNIGDFVWLLDGKVLNYIIERKKADDLASSIIDGRYKEQKYRLKMSNIKNVFYLFEGHATTNAVRSQKQLENALLKTRINQKFKVVKTKNINQSIKFLVYMHNELKNKIKSNEQLQVMGSLNHFNKVNSKNKNMTVQDIFGLGIKCFPGVGKNTVSQILKFFKSYKSLYDQLKDKQYQEKIQFLKELLKGGRTLSTFPKLLVDFLYSQQYI